MKLKRLLFLSLMSLMAVACVQTKSTAQPAEAGWIECKTPRSEMCTMEYRPVCAVKDTGIRCVTTPCPSEEHKTYGNACSACADPKVMGYRVSECPTGQK